MTSPFVNPVSGYKTLSRFDSFSWRPPMSTVVSAGMRSGGLALARRRLLRGAGPLCRGCRLLLRRLVLVARVRRGVALARLLGGGDARLERSHEVDDLV